MTKTKTPIVPFKDAFAKFLSENRDLRARYHCEVLLDLSSKLLKSRTADEISEAKRFVETFYQDLTDVVETLTIALDGGLPEGYVGFQNGKKHEYFAVQTMLMVGRIQNETQPTAGDDDQLMAWAESQSGKAIETAIEAYIDFVFPGRLDDLMVLLDLGVTGLLRRALGDLYTTIVPAAEPFFQKVLETPGLLDLLSFGLKELERKAKSEAASKAGRERGKDHKQLRLILMRKYDQYDIRWKSDRQAAIRLINDMKDDIGNLLKTDRRIATITGWVKDHNAAKDLS